MALADIFAPPQRTTFDARDQEALAGGLDIKTDVVTVDVTMSLEYEFGFEVSTNPVEEGIDITDHKRQKPIMIRLSGIVSDSPNDIFDVLAGNTGPTLSAIGIGDATTRSQDAYKRLIQIAGRAEPILLITQHDTFRNMTVTSFVVKKDDAGRYLGFSAQLQEVRFAQPEFGTFVPEVEHTAAPPAAALTQPAPLEAGPQKSIVTEILRSRSEADAEILPSVMDQLKGQVVKAADGALSVDSTGKLVQKVIPGVVINRGP